MVPVKLDPCDCLPFNRPRYAWCSETLYEMEGVELWQEAGHIRAYVTGGSLEQHQWVRPGWTHHNPDDSIKFPTL